VGAASFGDEMAGGRISVTYSSGAVSAASITAGGVNTGVASVANFFDFSVSGDTFVADWMLTNTTSNDEIILVEIDLSTTTSPGSPAAPGPHTPGILFDDDSKPSTANGFAGRFGAVQVNVGIPTIIASFEMNLWGDVMNEGDEFTFEAIEYREFFPGLTSIWSDDTDIVGVDSGPEAPEPNSIVLAALALVGLLAHGHRRRRAYQPTHEPMSRVDGNVTNNNVDP
jgi:MYXO-CTERM domain-containing protein